MTQTTSYGPETLLWSGCVSSSSLWGLQENLGLQSLGGKDFAQGCRQIAWFLLSVCKAQKQSFLITAVLQCRSLFNALFYLCSSNTLIINVPCQKAVKLFFTSQSKATGEKPGLFSLDPTILNTTISRLHTETYFKNGNLRFYSLFDNTCAFDCG